MKQLIKLCFFVLASAIICHDVFAQDMGVKSVNSSSKTVTIKSGKDNGLTKGSRVCFYNDSKKIACGKIKKVRKSMSIVKVRKSKLKKISTDSIARVSTSRRRKKRRRRRNTFRTGLKLGYSYMFLSPTSHNTPFYRHLTKLDEDTGAIVSNEPNGPNTSPYGMIRNRPRNSFGDSFLGGDLEFEFAFSKKMSVSLGGRYTHTSDLTERFSLAEGPSGQFNDSGYQNDLPLNSYIDLTTNTSAFGAWLDFNFFGLRMGRSVLLKFGVGIDAEIYNLNISATSSLPASTGEIKSVDYSNNGRTAVTLSGRVPIDFSYNTRSFGVGIKVIPMFSFLSMDLDKGNNIINGPELDPTTVSSINDLSVVTKWEEALDEDLEFGAGGISLEIQAIYFAYYF